MSCWLLYVILVIWSSCCYGQYGNDLTVTELHSRINQLESTVKVLLRKLVHGHDTNTESETKLTPVVEKRGYINTWLTGGEVGFHGALFESIRVERGQKIPFKIDETNIGYAYDEGSAHFICPRSGTYMFALTITCEPGSYLEAYIEVSHEAGGKTYLLNSVCDHRKRIISGETLYCGYSQNGGTTFVSLAEGDIATVKSDKKGTLAGLGRSTFSGYLLHSSD